MSHFRKFVTSLEELEIGAHSFINFNDSFWAHNVESFTYEAVKHSLDSLTCEWTYQYSPTGKYSTYSFSSGILRKIDDSNFTVGGLGSLSYLGGEAMWHIIQDYTLLTGELQ
jgi:hypothetical protein